MYKIGDKVFSSDIRMPGCGIEGEITHIKVNLEDTDEALYTVKLPANKEILRYESELSTVVPICEAIAPTYGPTSLADIQKLTDELTKHPTKKIRAYETGAIRDSVDGKYNYAGFLHPLVVNQFAKYMHKHRVQPDGGLRDADNWQKGIPSKDCLEGLFRHFMDVWSHFNDIQPIDFKTGEKVSLVEALCAMSFNINAMILNEIKDTKTLSNGE